MPNCVIALRKVVKYIGMDRILDGVNLEVYSGQIVVIRGRSGVGKTTLAKVAALILRPDEGVVEFLGMRVSGRDSSLLRLKYIGYVDQFCTLLPQLTVFENIELPLKLLGKPREERKKAVLRVLKELGIEEKAHRYPSELSGGERQRVVIARALVKSPKLIVADEPFSNLDDETAFRIMDLFKREAGKGAAIVITSTDLYTDYGEDKTFILSNGKLIER